MTSQLTSQLSAKFS